jgi:uncharacterized coiled-coil protein SlyX
LKNSITDFFQKVKAQHFAQNALYRQKNCSNLYLYGHFDDILEPEPGGQKMGQPITDYAAFFASAGQAVQELEALNTEVEQLEADEKKLESSLKGKQRSVTETISQTVKQRKEEITKSYDAELGKVQERLKKVKAKREKAKNQGVKERIEEDTRGLVRENKELADQIKTLFKANHVPGFCRGNYYYALYFTRTFKDFLTLLVTILICFLAIPCGVYFLIPERRTMYLVGIYVTVGNMTKVRYMDVLKEGLGIRAKIRANKKEMKVIAKTIRRDKNETIYNLQKFDDEIAQLDQDVAEINRKKKEALTTFDTVTRTIISDEITANNKEEIDRMEDELASLSEKLRSTRTAAKEKSLFITDNYEVYIGKGYMTSEKLLALADIVRSGAASNISDAIAVYKSQGETAK